MTCIGGSSTRSDTVQTRRRATQSQPSSLSETESLKGDKPTNGLIENAVMQLRGIIRMTTCPPRKIKFETTRQRCHRWQITQENFLSGCQNGRDWRTAYELLHGKRPPQHFVPSVEKVLARTEYEPQKQVRRLSWSEKQQCRVFQRYM